ncbi:MAG: GNAT family N-acetyltransferase, partial [Planctomycetes bacterium]|nr:GNAT family N-acetyltransferase [Planctomycetota bacterium]
FAGTPWFDRLEIPAVSFEALLGFLRLALAWFHEERRGWIALSLEELPQDCPTQRALDQLALEQDFSLYSQLASRAPMVVLDEGGHLSPRYARKLKASRRRLAELGGGQIDFFVPPEDRIDDLLDEMREVETMSWKGEQGVGVFRDREPLEFFTRLWRKICPLGDIALATLRVDGRLVAYHWGFRHRGRFLAYNLAQLPEANPYHGGLLLLDHIVHHGHELGFDILDASRGSLEIPNFIGVYHGPVRLHGHATIYNRGIKGQVMRLLRHGVFPAARAVLGQAQPPGFPGSGPAGDGDGRS